MLGIFVDVVLLSLFRKTDGLTGTGSPIARDFKNIVQRFFMKVIGIEVAKASVLCCVLDHIPENPAKYAKTYKAESFRPCREDLTALASKGDLFIMEPTGAYSRVWFEYLTNAGKDVRKVSPKRISHTRRHYGIESKTDRYDAFFIALYGQLYHNKPAEFLVEHAEILRELVLTHHSLSKASSQNASRIWRSLSYEWPEACTTKTGKKPFQSRPFLRADPPGMFRFIAGQPVRGEAKRRAELRQTIGSGLSDLTRLYARHLCELERTQYEIEQQISALLECSEFAAYNAVFDSFDFGAMTRAVLLSRIFPVERFLGDDGRPVIEHVRTDNGRSKRYVSLGSFKLSLGMGTVFKQSGTSSEETPGGAAYARSALFSHCKMKIVISPPTDLTAARRFEHRQYYEQIAPGMPHHKAVMKLAAKISKDLFRDLSQAI